MCLVHITCWFKLFLEMHKLFRTAQVTNQFTTAELHTKKHSLYYQKLESLTYISATDSIHGSTFITVLFTQLFLKFEPQSLKLLARKQSLT